MAAKKQVSIKLENAEGKVVEYKAGKIMARTTRDAMKMYSEMEQVDKDGNPELSEIEQLDMMIDLVADSIFKRVEEVTPEAILDRSEEHTSELQSRFDLVCRLLLVTKQDR